ncbi:DNA2/NAM7 helicase [Gracilaria domingensis]|nr:DNA2/NAM7 helicase [Gracilaria domingensis]
MHPYKDPIVRLLADEQGAQQLSRILSATHILDAGSASHLCSFQRVAVPLCFMLSHPDFTHSVRASDLSRIYHHVFNHKTFFMCYVNVLQLLLLVRQGDVRDERLRAQDPSEYHPTSALDCVTPFVDLCLTICRVVYQARTDCLWDNLIPTMSQVLDAFFSANMDTDRRAQQVLHKIDRLKEITTAKAKYISNNKTARKLPLTSEASESEIKAFTSQGPGSHRVEGPRHDNDLEHFRSIQVVPTEQEITCLIPPYLPFQSGRLAKASNAWIEDDIERHLDVQFRLMREDMIAPLRSAIHQFFLANTLSMIPKRNYYTFGEHHHSQGSCLLLRNVQACDVVASHTHGALIRLEFDQIFSAKKQKDRDIAWNFGSGSQLLQPNSIVCVALNVKAPANTAKVDENLAHIRHQVPVEEETLSHVDIGEAKLVFAYIHHEGRSKLGTHQDRCTTLHIQPVAFRDNDLLIDALIGKRSPGIEKTTNVLLQVRGHFVAGTIPVLKALQKSNLKGHTLVTKFLDKKRVETSATEENVEIGSSNSSVASYISSATRYDLSFLVKESCSEQYRGLEDVVAEDFDGLVKLLHEKENIICLDQSQIESFATGLLKDVAMIQGPPGCGKTYIGVKVMQALLRNSLGIRTSTWCRSLTGIRPPGDVDELEQPYLDPILCVCYTNHALDQFLSSLLDTGSVGLSEIVRVGSMSKNDALKTRSLESLARASSGFNQRRDIALIRSQCNAVEKELESHISRMKSKKYEDNCFSQWLQETSPTFYKEVLFGSSNRNSILCKNGPQRKSPGRSSRGQVAFQGDSDDEGFQLVGNFSSALNRWMLGKGGQVLTERTKRIEVLRAEFNDIMRVKMKDLFEDHKKWFQVLNETKNVSRLACLRRARVIGCTTSGAAKYNGLLQALAPAVIICEEAAEVLESHILSSLSPRTKQLILIGDHLQLRPKVSEYCLSRESGFDYDLDISLFERIAREGVFPIAKLKSQRRMHPIISQIPRETMYPYLLDSSSVLTLPERPKGFDKPLFFVSHRHPESNLGSEQTKSFSNVHEMEFVCALARYVIRQGYEPHQIAIVTPYVGQLLLFREMLIKEEVLVHIDELDLQDIHASGINIDNNFKVRSNTEHMDGIKKKSFEPDTPRGARLTSLKDCLRLSTVDNFQGEEAEIVLVSTVRCNDRGSVGFLKFSNRINVMLTRAKLGMYISGSAETIRSSRKATMFHTVLDLLSSQDLLGAELPLRCQNHGNTFFASKAGAIPGDGGCHIVCGARKSCGHKCRRRCHPDDQNHLLEDCMEDCQRLIPSCQHPCRRLCYQDCGDCEYPVHILLACGHEVDSVCKNKKDIEKNYKCNEIIASKVQGRCGHFNEIRCWEAGKHLCRKMCGGIRKCGHVCKNLCFECQATDPKVNTKDHAGVCKERCSRVLLCGHMCNSSPCHDSKSCPPCSSKKCFIQCEHSNCPLPCSDICSACCEPCSWQCTCLSQQKCVQLCATPCVRLPCDSRCSATLECGHQCPSLCGEKCPPKEYCPTCAREKKAYTTKTMSQTVDFVTLKTLEELVEDDGEDFPIIVLPCGHVFTMSTLDGHLDMESYYRKDSTNWSSVIHLEELKSMQRGPYDPKQRTKPRCILCKSAINGINRYKRITAFHDLVVIQRKWIVLMKEKYDFIANAIDRLGKALRGHAEGDSEEKSGSDTNQPSNRMFSIYKQAQQQASKANGFLTGEAEKCPTAILHDMEMACSIRQNTPLPKSDLSEMKPDPLPKLLAMEVCLRSTLLNARVACYYVIDSVNTNTSTNSEENTEPKEVKGLEKQTAQLKEANFLRKKARNDFGEIMQYCSVNMFERRRIDMVKIYALGLYELYSDLDNVGFNYQPEVPSTIEQKTDCAMELEELGKIFPGLQDLADDLLEKLSSLCYKPVTQEERKMVFHALARDVGSGIGGFGGHYYRCPNGHTYAIGDCGGAVMQSRCPECGATIGGLGHRLSQGNSIDHEFQRITLEEGNTYN